MTANNLCPHCRQRLPEIREGVRLSPLKARIFDAIKRARYEGITVEDINAICYDGRAQPVTIRAHIFQINECLADTSVQIKGSEPGVMGFYHLVRRPVRAVG